MDSHTLVKEIKRLLITNKKRALLFAIVFSLLLFAMQLVPIITTQISLRNSDNEKTSETADSENPAIFEMYIEYENGSVYTNTLLLEEAMKTDANIQAAEEATGVEISDLIEMEEKTNYPKTARDRGVLGASRNEASNIWVFSSRVGTEKENLAVVKFFYELVETDGLDLLNNKETYIISEPRILTDEDLSNPESLVTQNEKVVTFNIKNLVISAGISIVGGIMVAVFLLFLQPFFNKKIKYAFNYNWNEEDIFVMVESENKAGLERAVLLPQSTNKVLLVQEKNEKLDLSSYSEKGLQIIDDITKLNLDKEVDEVVILIQPDVTDRTWYNEQRELLKVYRKPLKVIQVNDGIL